MKRIRGFTLIEVVIVLAIMATLILIAKPTYNGYQKETARSQVKIKLAQLADFGVQHKTQNNGDLTNFYAMGLFGETQLFPTENPKYELSYTRSLKNSTKVGIDHFIFTARPIAKSLMDGDGVLCIDSNQQTLWVAGSANNASCIPTAKSTWDY